MENENNFKSIHKININGIDYYLYDHIIKKLDYFKPTLEKRFNEYKVKFDFCDSFEYIETMLQLLHSPIRKKLLLNVINIIYVMTN